MMQVFLASDVLLTARYRPKLIDALNEEQVEAEIPSINSLRFVEDVEWVNPDFVADQIAGIRGTDGGSATPGLHGNGLGTSSLGGVALTPGGSATVPLTADIAFDIQVTNQGDSTETDVKVQVTVGQGGDAIDLEETLAGDRARRDQDRDHPAHQAASHGPERAHHREREGGAGRGGHGQQRGRVHGHLHSLSRLVPWRPWTI